MVSRIIVVSCRADALFHAREILRRHRLRVRCVVTIVAAGTVERHAHRALGLRLELPERREIETEHPGDFLAHRLATELVAQRFTSGRQRARAAAHRRRHVVDPAKLVQDRAANPRNRKGAEGETAGRLEALQRLDQPHRAGAHELVQLDVRRDAAMDLPGHVVHQADVLGQQLLPCRDVTSAEGLPQGHICHTKLR